MPSRAAAPSCWLCSLVALAGCGDPPTGPPSATRVLPAWVTGEAAAALGPDGRFRFPTPAPRSMSRAHAESLAIAITRFYGNPDLQGNARAYLEEAHGGPIDFLHLRSCGRVHYLSSVTTVPAAPDYVVRYLAPQWVFPLCDPRGTPSLILEIPDAPAAISIATSGHLTFAPVSGNDWVAQGIPPGVEEGLAVSPEQAVAFAVSRSGRRVARVPQMLMRFGVVRGVATCAVWRTELDSPVTLHGRSSARVITTTEVFLYHGPECFNPAFENSPAFALPLADQPDSISLPFHLEGSSGVLDTARVAVTAPILFELAGLSAATGPQTTHHVGPPEQADAMSVRDARVGHRRLCCVIGGSAALLLGVIPDVALLLAGVTLLVDLIAPHALSRARAA
jgi:hypothetical protein